jgi:ABC-type branched-subunit amino acid transport system ATPase component
LLVEQQVRRALEVSDRWYLMRGGHILADSTMADSAKLLDEHYLFGTVDASADQEVDA